MDYGTAAVTTPPIMPSAAGEEKAMFHWTKVALLSIIAGTYCGFGFTLCLIVGGNAPQAWLEDAPGLFSLVFGAAGFPSLSRW